MDEQKMDQPVVTPEFELFVIKAIEARLSAQSAHMTQVGLLGGLATFITITAAAATFASSAADKAASEAMRTNFSANIQSIQNYGTSAFQKLAEIQTAATSSEKALVAIQSRLGSANLKIEEFNTKEKQADVDFIRANATIAMINTKREETLDEMDKLVNELKAKLQSEATTVEKFLKTFGDEGRIEGLKAVVDTLSGPQGMDITNVSVRMTQLDTSKNLPIWRGI